MRNMKTCIQQALKEQNSLEIEYIARNHQCTLLEAILEWVEDHDIDIYEFKNHVSEVLIERLRQESVKNNVIKDQAPDAKPNLHNIFLEL